MITELLSLSQCCLITFQFCDGFNIALLVNVLVVLKVDVKPYLVQTLKLTPNRLNYIGSGSYKIWDGTK